MNGDKQGGNERLLRFLVDNGLLTDEVAQSAGAKAEESEDHRPILNELVESGQIDDEQLARTFAARLRVPYINLAAFPLEPRTTALVREELASRYQMVPLRLQDDVLTVAVANPLDREGLRAIQFATGRTVRGEIATATAVRDAIEHAYHLEDALNAYLDGVPNQADEPVAELTEQTTDLSQLIRGSKLPPVVKLMNLILVDGIRAYASDIHIESSLTEVRVRYRIDGVLQEVFRLPKWVQDPLTARCKILASLDITERRVPQDGRIRIRYRDSMVDLRVSSLPTQFGEKVTMRILDPNARPLGLDTLHLQSRDLRCVKRALDRPQGIILVTGPTGSGKTTTLYGMIGELISPSRNIVTIENPIEYQIRGVNQVEINEKQGLTFAGTLRSVLRQDPDVILVGEIRDRETADIAIRAAQTGHLVLSTVHTNDSVATIGRMLDLGVDPYLLASSLHLVIAQRLVRRTCQQCAEPYEPEPHTLAPLGLPPRDQEYRKGRGCPACRRLGSTGREAVFEVMLVTSAMTKLIESRSPESVVRQQAREDGMVFLHENAVAKVLAGITTPDEVLRVIDLPEERMRCTKCDHVLEETFTVCPGCGTPVHERCQECGKKLQKKWQTCPYCGTRSEQAVKTRAYADSAIIPGQIAPVQPTGSADGPRRYRVLVVDDERDFCYLITIFLERSGMPIDVETASNGLEALESIKENTPDLILLDIMMPEMDGFEVCKRLRADVRTTFIPIVMLTALDDSPSRTRGFLAGTDDYMGKPFERSELLARVRRVLQRTYGLTSDTPACQATDASPEESNGHSTPTFAESAQSSG